MSRKSYVAVVDDVLKPLGFVRDGRQWTRRAGTVEETVELQVSSIAGTTANLWSYDTPTDDLLKKAIPWKPDVGMEIYASRIGILMTGYDCWVEERSQWARRACRGAEDTCAALLRVQAQP
jgi:hypothetical protein